MHATFVETEYGVPATVAGAKMWARISSVRPARPIETAAQYVGICRRLARGGGGVELEGEGRIDGRLVAAGFRRVPPMEWIRGERRDGRAPRLLADFVEFWEATQDRPETVGSCYNADPLDAYAFWSSGVSTRVARTLALSSWHCAVGRSGTVRPGRVLALAELSRRLGVVVMTRISRRRLRALLRFDSDVLRAADVTSRPDWSKLREADRLVSEQRMELRKTGAPCEEWTSPYVAAIMALRRVGVDITWNPNGFPGLCTVVAGVGAEKVAELWPEIEGVMGELERAMNTGANPPKYAMRSVASLLEWASFISAEKEDLLDRVFGWVRVPVGPVRVVLRGESTEGGLTVAGTTAIVHAESGAVVHATPNSIVYAQSGSIVHDMGGMVRADPGAIVVRDGEDFSAEARVAMASTSLDTYAVRGGRPLCPAYPLLPLHIARRIVLGESPRDISNGQLSRREAHEWCAAGCRVGSIQYSPKEWVVKDLPMEFRPRSIMISRWLVAVHDRGAWGQLTRDRVMHGPAGKVVRRPFLDVLDEIQDVDLVKGPATKVIDAFQSAAERKAKVHEANNPESDMELCPIPDWAKKLPIGIRVLRTPRQLAKEGKEQQHCVGSYGPAVASGQCIILSLASNRSRSTAEVAPDGSHIFQHLGAGNVEPTSECKSLLGKVIA